MIKEVPLPQKTYKPTKLDTFKTALDMMSSISGIGGNIGKLADTTKGGTKAMRLASGLSPKTRQRYNLLYGFDGEGSYGP